MTDFCSHAVDALEDVILEAIRQKFDTFALTEHMPRDQPSDLYPEEVSQTLDKDLYKKHLTPGDLQTTFDKYYQKAVALRAKYESQIRVLIGFETEYIRPESVQSVQALLQKFPFDYCVGSIHHVLGIPIDYSSELWQKARQECGGTDELLYGKYFDEQYDLLFQVRPLVIGHFDVIRLWAPDKMVRLRQWPSVWAKVTRNIDTVIQYGGLFELNSSAFRKGFEEAYPTSEIAKVITLSASAYHSRQ